MIVYTTVYSDADQSKNQSSASLAFVWGIHWGPVNSPHKWPVKRKMLPFDDVIMWKHFLCYWPFVRGFHRSPLNSPHKGEWRGALMFSLIQSWVNDWINNREAGDLKRHCAHYDITVMLWLFHCMMGIPIHNTKSYSFKWQSHIKSCPGAHFVNNFSIVIQIRWKIQFSFTPF